MLAEADIEAAFHAAGACALHVAHPRPPDAVEPAQRCVLDLVPEVGVEVGQAGKGVIVAMTLAEAEDAVRDMLSGSSSGSCR